MIQRLLTPSPPEFVEACLRSDPDATYDKVRRLAAEKDLAIYPSMFGAIRKKLRAERAAEAAAEAPAQAAALPARETPSRMEGIGSERGARFDSSLWSPLDAGPSPARSASSVRGSFRPLPVRAPAAAPTPAPAALLEEFISRVRRIEAQSRRFEAALLQVRGIVDETVALLDDGPHH